MPTGKRRYQTLAIDFHRNNFNIITKPNGKVLITRVSHGKLNTLTQNYPIRLSFFLSREARKKTATLFFEIQVLLRKVNS